MARRWKYVEWPYMAHGKEIEAVGARSWYRLQMSAHSLERFAQAWDEVQQGRYWILSQGAVVAGQSSSVCGGR